VLCVPPAQADVASVAFPLALTVNQFHLAGRGQGGDDGACACWQHTPALHDAASGSRWSRVACWACGTKHMREDTNAAWWRLGGLLFRLAEGSAAAAEWEADMGLISGSS